MDKLLVILDNGHGASQACNASPYNEKPFMESEVVEYLYARKMAKAIQQRITDFAVPYLLVPELETIPLATRCSRANELWRKRIHEHGLLVSIHLNAGGGTGWEVFTSEGDTQSDQYAEVFNREAFKLLNPYNLPLRPGTPGTDKGKEENFYILRNTAMPAVLTENLFMDSVADAIFQSGKVGFETLVDIHVNALREIHRSLTQV